MYTPTGRPRIQSSPFGPPSARISSPPPPPSVRRQVFLARYDDPRTVSGKENKEKEEVGAIAVAAAAARPLVVCDRTAPIPPELDAAISEKYAPCPVPPDRPPGETSVLLWEGVETFGRTGNNLIEFMHGLQYARDNDLLPGVMAGSWAPELITDMWMAIMDDPSNSRHSPERERAVAEWAADFEEAFCARVLTQDDDLGRYGDVVRMTTKDFFLVYRTDPNFPSLDDYAEYQCHVLRTLYRRINRGAGVNTRNRPARDMCSVVEAAFGGGGGMGRARYSVVHSRSLEGEPGERLLGRIARNSGCDPTAALEMEPEYVRAILEPLGMLGSPILFITDNQRPEILERLLADPEIGPSVRTIPPGASWMGGDVTAAVMADVFIGNPASTFSGFIAKSRAALGYDAGSTYMFRKRNKAGKWVDACDHRCIFDTKIMNAMA